MTNEPVPPTQEVDLAAGTTLIAPVTDDMMDHAAHEAAVMADSVAHAATEPPASTSDPDAARTADAPDAASAMAPAEDPAPVPAASSETTIAPAGAADEDGAPGRPAAAASFAEHGRAGTAPALGIGRLNAKILEIAAANMAAAGELAADLLAARSLPEVAAINADHMRRRLDALTTQGRELLLLTQKAALDAVQSFGESTRRS